MSRVLVIGDTHCPSMLEGYPEFLWDVYRSWNCDTVVHIGDLVDWHSISYHLRVAGTPDVMQEVDESRSQVQQLYRKFKSVTVLTGNHDALPSRRLADAVMATDMLRIESDYWGTPGWKWVPRFGQHVIDNVIYQHGDRGRGGAHAAIKNAKEEFRSVVQGHLHGQMETCWYANSGMRVFGMQVGCGVDHRKLSMTYGRRFNLKPLVGCGVVIDGKYPYVECMEL